MMKRLGPILAAMLLIAAAMPAPAEGMKVISFSPALTELIWVLGAGGLQIARSNACDYPAAATALPTAGKFAKPELETVLAMKPDLVVANDLINPGVARILRQNGIRVELRQCRDFDDYLWWVGTLGELLDRRFEAAAEVRRIQEFRAQIARQPRLPGKALWVIWDSPLMVAGSGSFPEMVLRQAGMDNIAADVGQEYFKCSYDWVLKNPPDVIIWSAPGKPDPGHRFWGQLEAVRCDRVVAGLDSDLIQRPGPRLTQGIAELRRKIMEVRERAVEKSEKQEVQK
ncbi:Vitamin B12-binding protein [bioreactor metagenome]|uniref:Vitamin B12-binding protein n=1 Tax=bioreactor metagenome TaxID=1076179 RepID=A0A644Z0F5_9ZZZZ